MTDITVLPKLVSVQQLKAGRALAGLTQKDLGLRIGVDQRQIRFWEKKIPCRAAKRKRIEQALEDVGVECFSHPTIGVRLM